MKFLTGGIIGFLIGASFFYFFNNDYIDPQLSKRTETNSYKYINPLLLCNNESNDDFGEVKSLENDFNNLINESKDEGTIISGSIYFRNLNEGTWASVNENLMYHPASLLKVPILISYLKSAEKDSKLLQRKAFYQQEYGQAPALIDKPVLVSGNVYSVEELIRGMIVDSDNTATKMLIGGMDEKFLNQVYSELGLMTPYSTPDSYMISTKTYALFFRILYNSTFLNREMSEKALSLMSEVKFDKGIVAGIGKDISIAHKYGFSIIKNEPDRIIELSDCGIVYYPDIPYLLCVMAQGKDPEIVSTFIKDATIIADEYIRSID